MLLFKYSQFLQCDMDLMYTCRVCFLLFLSLFSFCCGISHLHHVLWGQIQTVWIISFIWMEQSERENPSLVELLTTYYMSTQSHNLGSGITSRHNFYFKGSQARKVGKHRLKWIRILLWGYQHIYIGKNSYFTISFSSWCFHASVWMIFWLN